MVGGKENGCKPEDTMLLLQVQVEIEGTDFLYDTENTNPWNFRSTGCIRKEAIA